MGKLLINKLIFFFLLASFLVVVGQNVMAFHKDIYQPRVPEEILQKTREKENPFSATQEIIEKGKEVYLRKGMCVS